MDTPAADQPANVFRTQIRHPDLHRLYDYWESRRQGRLYPARADIDPLELKFALGHMSLIDVIGTPPRFRFRLMGSLLAQRLGWDLTNRMVDEIPDSPYRDYLIKTYRAVVEAGRPACSLNERMIGGKPRRFEVLRLPLAEDGQTINMILICPMYFEPLPRRPALGPLADRGGPPTIIEDL